MMYDSKRCNWIASACNDHVGGDQGKVRRSRFRSVGPPQSRSHPESTKRTGKNFRRSGEGHADKLKFPRNREGVFAGERVVLSIMGGYQRTVAQATTFKGTHLDGSASGNHLSVVQSSFDNHDNIA